MSTLRLTTISNQDGSATVPSQTVISGSAKAWVNFNASSGTPVIRASFNVSSITDGGVGIYTVNLTNAVADGNYTYAGVCGTPGVTNGYLLVALPTPTASTWPLVTVNTAVNLFDPSFVLATLFR
jgi:hypothetical protein